MPAPNSPLSTGERKTLFLIALRSFRGNVTKACHAIQLARQTYYNWIEEDEDFQVQAKLIALECTEELMDEAEDVMRFALKDPRESTGAAKWLLSKLGKARGYGNKVTIEHQGDSFKGNEYPDAPESVDDWEENDGEPEARPS